MDGVAVLWIASSVKSRNKKSICDNNQYGLRQTLNIHLHYQCARIIALDYDGLPSPLVTWNVSSFHDGN